MSVAAKKARAFQDLLEEILEIVRGLRQYDPDPWVCAGLAAIERTARQGTEMAHHVLDALEPSSMDPHLSQAAPRVPSARILVVGEPEALGRDLTAILVRQGHQVERLDHPLQVLARLRADDADLLFTDLGTPDFTGWELASRARAVRPGLSVIVVTRYAPQLDRARLQALGVAWILSRPYLEADVAQIVAASFRLLPRAA